MRFLKLQTCGRSAKINLINSNYATITSSKDKSYQTTQNLQLVLISSIVFFMLTCWWDSNVFNQNSE